MRRIEELNTLVISEVRGDTRRYRALHLIEQLRLLKIPCQYVHLTDPKLKPTLAKSWDLVILHRTSWSEYLEDMLLPLRKAGSIILSDFDDLIFDVEMFWFIKSPDFVDAARVKLYQEKMRSIGQMLEHSEGALASTDYLADRIGFKYKPAWVHRNAFSFEMLHHAEEARRNKHEVNAQRVILGYASGTPTHNDDFDSIKPAIVSTLKCFPQAILQVVGPLDIGAGWDGLEDRVIRTPLVPWRQLPAVLSMFDINLAPLILDNPFTQSKSEIKWMEAAMVGVPTIASPTDAFSNAIQPGVNGFLAGQPTDWAEKIAWLIENAQLRSEIGEQACEDTIKSYHPVVRAQQLGKTLAQITLQLRQKTLAFPAQGSIVLHPSYDKRLAEKAEREPSNLQLGLYSLRVLGVKTLLMQVWVFVRRLLVKVFPFRSRSKGE